MVTIIWKQFKLTDKQETSNLHNRTLLSPSPIQSLLTNIQIGATFLADNLAINIKGFKMVMSFDPRLCSLAFFPKNMIKDVFNLLVIKIILTKMVITQKNCTN